jgi:RNA polymerase sigma-70 factor (ECF subfamily)
MDSFERFYRDNLRLVYAMALARGAQPCEAEDLAQETFLRAWRHSAPVAGMEPLAQRAWLIRTLRNLMVDAWRRGRPAAVEGPETPDPGSEFGERAALRLDVVRALDGLDETDREVVVLRYFVEMNSREIGELLGLPEGTVRHRLMRCRQYLAARLSQWDPEGGRR